MAPAEEATLTPTTDALEAPQSSEPVPTAEEAPPERDWKEEYARLRKDYDVKSSRLKEFDKPVASPKTIEDSDIDFKIENAGRIKLVKEDFKQELADLKAAGAKTTPAIMEKALSLAESRHGIPTKSSDVQRQAGASSPSSVTDRSLDAETDVPLTESDRAFGVTPEAKKKWRHIVER